MTFEEALDKSQVVPFTRIRLNTQVMGRGQSEMVNRTSIVDRSMVDALYFRKDWGCFIVKRGALAECIFPGSVIDAYVDHDALKSMGPK